jgi:MOSC domain-containing protein YiiM
MKQGTKKEKSTMNQTNDVLRDDESGSDEHSRSAGGMVGDRYYLRRGRDAAYDQFTCDVTLIELETIEAMKQAEPSIDPGESARRNIVVRDCALSQLVGRTFRIGDVTLRGLARRDSDDGSSESVQQAAPHESTTPTGYCLVLPRPDLRTMVLTKGMISVGDRVEVL